MQEREIEQALGITVSRERTLPEQEQEQGFYGRSRERETSRGTPYARGIQEQPFYGESTEYNINRYRTQEPEIGIRPTPLTGTESLERTTPLNREFGGERRTLEFTPSWEMKTEIPVEELFLAPIGESYFKREEEIRRKRVRK